MPDNPKHQIQHDTIWTKNSIVHYYRELIALRNSSDVIKYGDFRLLISEHPQLFAYRRTYQDERILVCCNFSEETVQLPGDISGEVLLQFGNQNRSLAAYGALVVGLNL